jgi:uncharacterized Zn finger protein (UPF0148 family)
MAMILKACNRCGGDLVRDSWDWQDGSLICLQCGSTIPMTAVTTRHAVSPGLDSISQVLMRLKKAS